jgi:hypothetical protein
LKKILFCPFHATVTDPHKKNKKMEVIFFTRSKNFLDILTKNGLPVAGPPKNVTGLGNLLSHDVGKRKLYFIPKF